MALDPSGLLVVPADPGKDCALRQRRTKDNLVSRPLITGPFTSPISDQYKVPDSPRRILCLARITTAQVFSREQENGCTHPDPRPQQSMGFVRYI